MKTVNKVMGAVLIALAGGVLGGCYVEAEAAGPEMAGPPEQEVPVYEGYRPMYYNGYVVYYDSYARPFYYVGGAPYWVPRGYAHYNVLVAHYNRYRAVYPAWHARYGARYRTYSYRGVYRR